MITYILIGVAIGAILTIVTYEVYLKHISYSMLYIDTTDRDKDVYRFEWIKDPYYIRKHKRVIYKIKTGVDLSGGN